MTGQLTFAFIAGTVASANPCGFALLPAYVARQLTADASASNRSDALARALLIGALTTAGFLVVFGSLGTAITLGLHWLTRVVPWLALAIGVSLVLAGIAVLTGRRIGSGFFARVRPTTGNGYGSVVLFGLGYGVASLSCTLPIFLVVAATASTGSVPVGTLTFAAYALGMGTILTALAVAAALSRAGVATAVRRLRPHFTRLSGALLLAAGAYVAYYGAVELASPTGGGSGAKPIRIATHLSTAAQAWLSGQTGKTVSATLASLLVALAAVTVVRAARHRARRRKRSAGADSPLPKPATLGARGAPRAAIDDVADLVPPKPRQVTHGAQPALVVRRGGVGEIALASFRDPGAPGVGWRLLPTSRGSRSGRLAHHSRTARWIAVLLVAAGAINLALTPRHFAPHLIYGSVYSGSLANGIFFLAASLIELLFAGVLLLRPGPRAFRAGALIGVGLIAGWLATRATAAPLVPQSSNATGEAADALELAAALALLLGLPIGGSSPGPLRFAWRWAALAGPGFVLLFLLASGSLGRVPFDLAKQASTPWVTADTSAGFGFRSPWLEVAFTRHVLFATSWAVPVFLVVAGALVALTTGSVVGLARSAGACRPQATGLAAASPAFVAVPTCCGAALPIGAGLGGSTLLPLLSATPWILLAEVALLSANLVFLRRRWRGVRQRDRATHLCGRSVR